MRDVTRRNNIRAQELLEYEDYLTYENNLAVTTIRLRMHHAKTLRAFLNSKPLTLTQARKFLLHCRKSGMQPSSVNSVRASVRLFTKWKLLEATNDTREELQLILDRLEPLRLESTLPDYFTISEMKKIIDCEPPDLYGLNPTWRLLFRVLASHGLRVSEATKLRVRDILHSDGCYWIQVRKSKTGDRVIKLSANVVHDLIVHTRDVKPDQYIFTNRCGNRISGESVNDELKKRGKIIGIKKERCHSHNFRHGFCTEASRAGLTPQQIMPVTGHRNLKTLQKYVHLSGVDTKIVDEAPTSSL